MTQEEVAKKLNISPQAYAKIESGDTKLDIKRFQEIADILEIPLEDIHKLIDGSMNIVVKNNGNQQIGKHSTFHQESDKTNELLEKIITEQNSDSFFARTNRSFESIASKKRLTFKPKTRCAQRNLRHVFSERIRTSNTISFKKIRKCLL